MRFVVLTAWKDLLRILRDPAGLIAWLAMPILLNGLVALIFTEGNPMPQGRLLLVDEDQSLVSGLIAGAFSREPLSKMILIERVEAEQGRKRINAGDGSALLIIPKGFGQAFLRRERSTLTLLKNPSNRIVPELIAQSLEILLEGAFYLQKVLGPQFDRFNNSDAAADADVAATSVAVNRLGKQLSAYLNPPLIEVERKALAGRKQIPFSAMFFPGMLLLAVFGMSLSRSEDLWRERAQGTLRRALTTPRSMEAFFGGKILGHGILFAFVGALGILLARFALGMEIHNALVAIVWVACSGVALYLINVVLQLAASDQRAGVMLSSFVLFLFGMLGGTFFPFEMMPPWLAAIGRCLPNGWMLARFKEITAGPVAAGSLLLSFAILLPLTAIAFWLVSRRLQRWSV